MSPVAALGTLLVVRAHVQTWLTDRMFIGMDLSGDQVVINRILEVLVDPACILSSRIS